jgi:anti-sigma B factor antagonist
MSPKARALAFISPVAIVCFGTLYTIERSSMTLKIDSHSVNGITVVSCHGRIVFGDESNFLRDKLKGILASSRQVILDLSDVSYIDSGGLGTLVGLYSSARSAGADVKLVGLNQRIRDVLQITKLVTVFEVYDTEQQAITAFGGKA